MSDGLTIRMLRQIRDFFFWANSQSQRKNFPRFERFGFSFWKNCSKVLVPVLDDPELAFFGEPYSARTGSLFRRASVSNLGEPCSARTGTRFGRTSVTVSQGISCSTSGFAFRMIVFQHFWGIFYRKNAPHFSTSQLQFFWRNFVFNKFVPNLNDHGPAFSEQLLERNILHTRNFANNNFTDKEFFNAFEHSVLGSVQRGKNVCDFALFLC